MRARHCASFCAPSASEVVTIGSEAARAGNADKILSIQHDSERSHSVAASFAAPVNRRVASSNLARGAISSLMLLSGTASLADEDPDAIRRSLAARDATTDYLLASE